MNISLRGRGTYLNLAVNVERNADCKRGATVLHLLDGHKTTCEWERKRRKYSVEVVLQNRFVVGWDKRQKRGKFKFLKLWFKSSSVEIK